MVTTGTFSEAQGLNGEADLDRLTLVTLAGDAGGAVLNGSGAMIGMLLPRKDEAGRELPKDVSFALKAGTIGTALEARAYRWPPRRGPERWPLRIWRSWPAT